MSEFVPRDLQRTPGRGRGFSVVLWSWIVVTLALGATLAVATIAAVDGPEAPGRRLRVLQNAGYVVRGEYVVDDGALTIARWALGALVVVVPSIIVYTIVVASRAGLRAEKARAEATGAGS
jgi:hypothetical protein